MSSLYCLFWPVLFCFSSLCGKTKTYYFAADGEEALNAAASSGEPELYDIILMDLQMPKMDGLEAARRIRALPGGKGLNVPIIAISANTSKQDVAECIAAGMNDHMGKPVKAEKLLRKINKYL
jgi:CheY-like chemotaxis protein